MSAKLLYNLSDENPNLHRQMGCMNGILQVFYRQQYPGRRVVGHGQKILPPGETNDQPGDANGAMHKEPERTKRKAAKEKQRVSTESSSRLSFSSTPRSSSFSSADISTASQCEPPPSTQTSNCENSVREVPNGSPQWGNVMPCDLRELVKDSIHRDTRGLSVKTTVKDEVLPQQPESARASVSLLKESLRSPSRNSHEWSEGRRVAQLKDSPRLSYDERELRNKGYKTAAKLKEPPRLSLDSRANSFRSPRADARSNCSPEDEDVNGQQEPACHRRMSSSVVAKLMGLEILPATTATEQNDAVDHDSSSRPLVKADNDRQNRLCDSPRPSHVEAASLRSRSADSVKKITAASKFPMETAPWKQVDGTKSQLKNQAKAADSTLTVYGEIQKRLEHLEFKKSGKDLRALKQILEAMEKTQQLIDNRKDNAQISASLTRSDSTLVQRSNQPIPAAAVATNPSKNFRSPIMVMKPAKVFEGASKSASALLKNIALPNLQVGNSRQSQKDTKGKQTAMDLTPRPGHYQGQLDSTVRNTSARQLQSKQTSAESFSMKSDIIKSGRSQYNVGPRQQQNKLGMERQSRPITPTSESSKMQRQHGRLQMESASPRRRQRKNSRNLRQSDDRLSDVSCDLRSLSHQSDARSLRSESNLSLVSNPDNEVTSKYRFDKTYDISEQHTPKQRSPDLGFKQDRPMLKPVKVTVEQPSPVSVLDATFYEDESPSPVRKISTIFKEDDTLSSEDTEWINEAANHTSTGFRGYNMLPENNRRLANTNSYLDECLIEEITFPCDVKNTNREYISEILLASGLLRDLEYSMISIQLHQSRLPINPNLFFVLEQNKASSVNLKEKQRGKGIGQKRPTERIRRKLVFDTVNEILAQRFVSEGCTKLHITSSPLLDKRSRGMHLLQTLCSEIDQLQANNLNCSLDDDEDIIWEDLQNQGMRWSDIEGETPAIVLDIERLIFKDLISEVVTSEVAAVQGRFSRHPRQLFMR